MNDHGLTPERNMDSCLYYKTDQLSGWQSFLSSWCFTHTRLGLICSHIHLVLQHPDKFLGQPSLLVLRHRVVLWLSQCPIQLVLE